MAKKSTYCLRPDDEGNYKMQWNRRISHDLAVAENERLRAMVKVLREGLLPLKNTQYHIHVNEVFRECNRIEKGGE